jgi:hypothetical protein
LHTSVHVTPTERDHGALTKAHPIEARLRRHAATRKYQAARHHRPLQIGCVSTSTQRVSARTLHTSPALLMERHSGQVDDVIAHTANGPDACQVVFHVTSQHRASLGAIVAYPNSTIQKSGLATSKLLTPRTLRLREHTERIHPACCSAERTLAFRRIAAAACLLVLS